MCVCVFAAVVCTTEDAEMGNKLTIPFYFTVNANGVLVTGTVL